MARTVERKQPAVHRRPGPEELTAADLVYSPRGGRSRLQISHPVTAQEVPSGEPKAADEAIATQHTLPIELVGLAMNNDQLLVGEVRIAGFSADILGFILSNKQVVLYFDDRAVGRLFVLFSQWLAENSLSSIVAQSDMPQYFENFVTRLLKVATAEVQQVITTHPTDESWFVDAEMAIPLT